MVKTLFDFCYPPSYFIISSMKPKPNNIRIDSSKAKHNLAVNGIDVCMPYEPYDGQKMFIEYVYSPPI